MRRLFVILLIVLVPFQASWGASARYCEHESEQAVSSHFGHHKHIHMGEDSGKSDAGWSHADCMACHLVASHAVFSAVAFVAASSAAFVLSGLPHWSPLPSPVFQPERPQWRVSPS